MIREVRGARRRSTARPRRARRAWRQSQAPRPPALRIHLVHSFFFKKKKIKKKEIIIIFFLKKKKISQIVTVMMMRMRWRKVPRSRATLIATMKATKKVAIPIRMMKKRKDKNKINIFSIFL